MSGKTSLRKAKLRTIMLSIVFGILGCFFANGDIRDFVNSGKITWTGSPEVIYLLEGSVSNADNYDNLVLKFSDPNSVGSFVLSDAISASAHILLVGGGGAGANPGEARPTHGGAGGGGAGGFVEETDFTFESGTYVISVGAGGVSPEEQGAGGNGSPSFVSFGGNTIIEAFGGGGGGIMADVGRDGGSGGGGSRSGSPGSGASEQGNDGGVATIARSGGGGGGAGGIGASPVSSSIGGAGGDGRESVITGESVIYAAGGGGGARTGTGGTGGGGVGGNGGGTGSSATSGIDGTGSGGGGGSYSSQVGGNGGSGVVIVRITTIVGPKVDFDSSWESLEFWRSVHENSTLTGSMTPRLVANAELETSMKMFVWSDDESAVYVNTDNIVDMRVSATGDTEPRHVGVITLFGGQTSANFSIVGASGGAGKTANLVLSAYPNFNYSGLTGQRILDYTSVPVKCIEPLPRVVSVECDTATLVADADYLTAKARLSVRLSQPCDEDVTVTLTPSFEDEYSGNWADYIRFSTSADSVMVLPSGTSAPSVVIPAGSTERRTVYVFALRSDTHTIGIGHQLRITPSATGVDSCISCGFWISANAPRIVSPTAGFELSTLTGSPVEIPIEISDTFADMTGTSTGYSVRFKASESSEWTELPEKFRMDEFGLVGITTGNLPAITYASAGDFVSQIYVVSPISGKKSDPVSFTVHAVAPPPTATVTTLDECGNIYNEGDEATFQVALSEVNDTGSTIYVFLKAGNGATAAMFDGPLMFVVCDDTDMTKTEGLRIGMNQSTAQGMIDLLDNPAAANGQVSFSVVLCSTEQYDSANVLGGFQSNNLTIKVNNVEPSINRIELNGFESDCDGYVFPRRAIVGASQTFQAVVQDAANDLSADFETKWTVYCDGIERWSETIVGNPHVHANAYSCSFPRSGAWTVRCQVKDKDMDDWSEQSYSVGVNVIQPGVTLTTDDSYLETDSRKSLEVGLNYYDYNADEIVVKLTVTPPDRTNPGELVLDSTYKTVPTGYPVLGDNEYYVSLRKYDSLASVGIVSMDGTAASSMYGFRIKAEVVTPEWSDVYVPATKCVNVHNVAPTVDSVTPESPNAMMAPGGVASTPISWQVRSDVDADLAAGITVRFEGCGNAFTTNVTEATGGSFVPDFGSRSGSQSVTMTIEDKDGASQTWTYLYYVQMPPEYIVADGVLTGAVLNDATKVEIPQGVVRIGESVFADCSSLTSVVIPDSVTNIADNAFRNCILLTSVVMEGDCPEVGVDAFYGVDPSCVVRLPANNSTYTVNDGKWQGMNVYGLPIFTIVDGVLSEVNLNGATNVVIPSCVTNIGDGAFEFCRGLTNVTIPDSVTSIGEYAFERCFRLESVTIPDSVRSIGDEAFDGCSGMTSITIPNSVTNIGYGTFRGCSGLTNVTLSSSATGIGDWAFAGCEGLMSVTIPDGVTSIGDYAFMGCFRLESVTIPDSVTSIGEYAFQGCEDLLDTMTIPGVGLVDGWTVGTVERPSGHLDLTGIRGIGPHAFMACGRIESVTIGKGVTRIAEHAFSYCYDLTEVVLPDSVTSIGAYAFEGCGLTSVTIPDSVTNIGDNAFSVCQLTNVVFNGNAPEVGASAFDDDPDITVYVRRGSTGWGVDIPGTWQGMRIEYLDVVEVNGAAVEFETASDGKTRTAAVAAGTTAEDVKVFVGGVDVTAGFKVAVEGTTATVVLKEPYETARSASAPYQENEDGTTVTLNVEVVPGLYYAADSAATIEALKRPSAVGPAKAGDAVVVPKQTGEQGFYKVWVSDSPMEAE